MPGAPKQNHMKSGAGRLRKELKRTQAVERQELRAGRTAKDQLAVLDAKLGAGVGATRERARLAKEA